MASVTLSVEPDLCGPVSVGTVAVIRILQRELGLSLGEALGYVNRSVFDGEQQVEIPAPSASAAARCVARLSDLRSTATVRAQIGGDRR